MTERMEQIISVLSGLEEFCQIQQTIRKWAGGFVHPGGETIPARDDPRAAFGLQSRLRPSIRLTYRQGGS